MRCGDSQRSMWPGESQSYCSNGLNSLLESRFDIDNVDRFFDTLANQFVVGNEIITLNEIIAFQLHVTST